MDRARIDELAEKIGQSESLRDGLLASPIASLRDHGLTEDEAWSFLGGVVGGEIPISGWPDVGYRIQSPWPPVGTHDRTVEKIDPIQVHADVEFDFTVYGSVRAGDKVVFSIQGGGMYPASPTQYLPPGQLKGRGKVAVAGAYDVVVGTEASYGVLSNGLLVVK